MRIGWLAGWVAALGCVEFKTSPRDASRGGSAEDVAGDAGPMSEAPASDGPDEVTNVPVDSPGDLAMCPDGRTGCAGACVELRSSTLHCGACGNTCPIPPRGAAACVDGACGVACAAGWGDCDGEVGNGCETSVTMSASDCGACGATCAPPNAASLCVASRCRVMSCLGGFNNCDGDDTNGCELSAAELSTSAAHCGRCGNACAAGRSCCGGACVDTGADGAHCGRCGGACPEGAACVAGACVCPSGQSDCGGTCRATGAACIVGVGACARAGTVACYGSGVACSAVPGLPSAELCDGVDNDCDGLVDDGFCRIAGVCYADGQLSAAGSCRACVAPPTAAGPTAWGVAVEGAVCRASAGPCDRAETCDGSSELCPADTFAPSSAVCRPPAGPCDVVERCSGTGAACPADAFTPRLPGVYTRTTSPLRFVDACATPGHVTSLSTTDDGAVLQPLLFPFRYYDSTVSSVGISSNGLLRFGGVSGITAYTNGPLPNASTPDTVFVFWDDLMTRGAGVCTTTLGVSPDRTFVVHWSDAHFSATDDPRVHLSFEAVLSEGANTIDVLYDRMEDPMGRAQGASATIGIQRDTGSSYEQVSYNATGATPPGQTIRWAPRVTVCRPPSSAVPCDLPEVCTGAASDCPADLPSGLTRCGEGCFDLANDRSNCGGCGTRCSVGLVCAAGACAAEQASCRSGSPPGCGLVEVGGGTFTLGASPSCGATPDATCVYGATPSLGGVRVGNFALDAHEVTVARFRAFWSARPAALAAIRAAPIEYPDGRTIAWTAEAQEPAPLVTDSPCNWSPSDASVTAHPMNCLDWWLAQEFCVWDGGRLPTEAEWEYAARGRAVDGLSPGRLYPWGDTAPSTGCDRALWNGCAGSDGRSTRRVGSFAATGGFFDLAGNTFEWTADMYAAYGTAPCWNTSLPSNPLCNADPTAFRAPRGGSYTSRNVAYLRAASRPLPYPVEMRLPYLGFRCARTRP